MKKQAAVFGVVAFLMSNSIFAGNALLDSLVEKNILTGAEAADISSQMPSPLVWTGDVRMRFQSEKLDGKSDSRDRTRFRLRLGTKAKINDKITAGFGISSGESPDARSNNQSFGSGGNAFEFYTLSVNHAYIQYAYDTDTTVILGKMNKPFWVVSDMLWDQDINPDGVAVQWKANAPFTEYFVNAGYFVMNEMKSDTGFGGASLMMIQPGVAYTFDKNTEGKIALSIYKTNNVMGVDATKLANGKDNEKTLASNTLSGEKLVYEYNPVILTGELKLKEFTGLPYASLFGEYVNNPGANSGQQAALIGVKFGNEKVKKEGEWQGQLTYRYLQADAWLDIFPDSDYYSGNTGVQGVRAQLQYAVANNTVLSGSYYRFEKLTVGDIKKSDLFQLDLQVSF